MSRADRGIWGVLALALALRLAALGASPPGPSLEEASAGYEAWSLLLEGRSGAGGPAPPGAAGGPGSAVGALARLPLVALLGPSLAAVRAPSALLGAAGVAATYLLARRLWGRREARVAALLLAVSPWHVHLSRTALEPALLVASTALSLGLLLGSGRELALAGPAVAIGACSGAAGALLLPPLAALVLLARGRELRGQGRSLALGAILLLAVLAPLARLEGALAAQARAASAAAGWADGLRLDASRRGLGAAASDAALRAARRWALPLSPSLVLAVGGPDPLGGLPGWGLVHPVLLPFVLAGLALSLREGRWALLAWLAIAPALAAASGPEAEVARHAAALLPLPELLAARGFSWVRGRSGALAAAAVALLALSASAFGASYAVDYPRHAGAALRSDAPLREALSYARSLPPGTRVAVDPSLEGARVQALFAYGLDPERFRSRGWEGTGLSFGPPAPGALLLTRGGPDRLAIEEVEVLGRACGRLPGGPALEARSAPGRLAVSARVELRDICTEMGFEVEQVSEGLVEVRLDPVQGGACERHCPGQMLAQVALRAPAGPWRARVLAEGAVIGESSAAVPPEAPQGEVVRAFSPPDGTPVLWLVRT